MPSAEKLLKVSNYLNVSIEMLLEKENQEQKGEKA
jgi:hypothetical protein